MHQFRDKSVAQRELVVRRAALLPGADGRRRARLPRARGAGGRGPARAHRADARRRRGASTRASARRWSCPRAASPRSARASATSRSPTRKMSTTGGTEQGTVYVLDEPDAIAQEVQARGHRLGQRDRARRGQARHLEPDRDPRGGARHDAGAIEHEFADAALRRLQGRGRRGGRRVAAPVRERYAELRGRRGRARGDPRGRRREGPRDRRAETLADVRERDGRRARSVGPRGLASADVAPSPTSSSTSTSSRARSTSCSSLILREELDLLEVELADVVARLPRPPRGARRARPRGGDRVPRPDRRAAGAQVAADAAGRGGRGARRAGARRGGRGAAGADARYARFRGAGELAAPSAPGAPRPSCTARAPLPPSCGGALGRAAPRPPTTRPCSAPRSAACCARRRRSTSRHMAMPRVTRRRAPRACCASCCAAARFDFDEAVRDADRVTVAVTLFALLELYKRGEASGSRTSRSARSRVNARRAPPRVSAPHDPAADVEALLFLSPEPVSVEELRRRLQTTGRGGGHSRRSSELRADLHGRGVVLREIGGGWTLATHPDAEEAARRLLSRPRTPALTPAQAETLSVVAYLQPVSRPEMARIRGVASESATSRAGRARADRGGRPLAVRRRPVPHDAAVPQALRPALARGAARARAVGPEPRGRRPRCATACCARAGEAPWARRSGSA